MTLSLRRISIRGIPRDSDGNFRTALDPQQTPDLSIQWANTSNSSTTNTVFVQIEDSSDDQSPFVVFNQQITVAANDSKFFDVLDIDLSATSKRGELFLHGYVGDNSASATPETESIGPESEFIEIRDTPVLSNQIDTIRPASPAFVDLDTIVATEDDIIIVSDIASKHTRDRLERAETFQTRVGSGSVEDSQTVFRDAQESALSQLRIPARTTSGSFTIQSETGLNGVDDTDSETITVVSPPDISASDVTLQPELVVAPVVIAGGRIDIETTLQNTGDVRGSETLSITLAGTEIVSRSVSVGGDTTETVTDVIDTKGVVGPGTHTVEATIGGSSASATLEVEPLPGDRIRIAPGNDSGPRVAPGSTTVRGP